MENALPAVIEAEATEITTGRERIFMVGPPRIQRC